MRFPSATPPPAIIRVLWQVQWTLWASQTKKSFIRSVNLYPLLPANNEDESDYTECMDDLNRENAALASVKDTAYILQGHFLTGICFLNAKLIMQKR